MAKKYFSWSPIRDLMKDAGAKMVSRDAVDELINYLESSARKIIGKALELTRHSDRKKLVVADIKLAETL